MKPHPYRIRSGMGVCTILLLFSGLSPACLRNVNTAGAVAVVEEFFSALESREPARIGAVAPQLENHPFVVEQLLNAFSDGVGWSVIGTETETRSSERSTIVVVAIDPAHAGADPIRIGVPVRYRRGRWEILNEITVTQNIGIVPLNDS